MFGAVPSPERRGGSGLQIPKLMSPLNALSVGTMLVTLVECNASGREEDLNKRNQEQGDNKVIYRCWVRPLQVPVPPLDPRRPESTCAGSR
jgi:hypothetical protein